jgi:hypothetical protein
MQVHFTFLRGAGQFATYRVDCEAYCGQMMFDAYGGRNQNGRITFNPNAVEWFALKVVDRIFESGPPPAASFALYIDPPNPD